LGDFTINNTNGRSFIAKIDYDGTFKNAFAFVTGIEVGSKVKSLATNNSGVFYVGGKLYSRSVPTFSCIPRDANTGLYLGKFTEEPDVAPQPSISLDGFELTASPEFTGVIQWFLNGEVISGASYQTYTAVENGKYSVSYSYVQSCISTSAETNIVSVGLTDNLLNTFEIYPCPFQDDITVELTDFPETSKLAIFDYSGRRMYENTFSNGIQKMDLSSLKPGVYLFQISNSKGIYTRKLIKQN